ncbi:MAG: NYN domain-containing protein [Polaromonas sp.]
MIPVQGTGAGSLRQAALLIDADNFSDPQAIHAAWAELEAYAGRVSACRAYGHGPRLQSLWSVWRYLGARTFPNLALEKNTTDAALIADAVALHFQQGVRIFAIASGDADFAPLAVRLREWGCEVWCFSMEGIVFRDAETYYDRVVQFCPPPPPPPLPVAPVVAVKLPVKLAAPLAPEETPTMPVFNVVPRVEKSLTLPLHSPKPVSNPDVLLPDEVRRILEALPGLREGPQHLSQAAAALRQQGILGKTVKSTQFLAPYAAYFKLSPPQQPNRLVYIPPRSTQPVPAKKVLERAVISAPAPAPAPAPAAEVLSWPVSIRRQATLPLLAELHGLRSVLVQLAVRRVCVADVLLAVPEMVWGQPCALNAVAGRLRESGLLRSSQSALRVLERHPRAFAIELNAKTPAVIYLR